MFAAKPSVTNAAGYASSQTEASGPGESVYGASMSMSSVHLSWRNSARPPTPILSAIGPPPPPSADDVSVAGFALAGFFAAASSSPTGDGGGAAFGLSSSSSAPELGDLSSLLASSLSGAESGSAALPFDFVAGVLCF